MVLTRNRAWAERTASQSGLRELRGEVLAARALQVARRVRYERDHAGGAERIRSGAVAFAKGGDCEDVNLLVMGALLQAAHPDVPLASVYMPCDSPQHVYLRFGDLYLDAVCPTWCARVPRTECRTEVRW